MNDCIRLFRICKLELHLNNLWVIVWVGVTVAEQSVNGMHLSLASVSVSDGIECDIFVYCEMHCLAKAKPFFHVRSIGNHLNLNYVLA